MGDLDKSSVSLPHWATAARDAIAQALGVPDAVASRILITTHPLIAPHSPRGVLVGFPGAPPEHPGSTPIPRGSREHPPSTPTTEPLIDRGSPGVPGSTPRAPRCVPSYEEERERDPTLRSGGVPGSTPRPDYCALTAELVGRINATAGTSLRTDDPAAQRALVSRLTGHELAEDDAGPADLDQVRAAVEHCTREWTPKRLSLQVILGRPAFWTYHGQAAAPTTPAGAGPQPLRRPTLSPGYFERDGSTWYRDGAGNEQRSDGPVTPEEQAELARAAQAAANSGGGE